MIDPQTSALLNEILKGVAIVVVPAVAGFIVNAMAALAKKWGLEGVAVDKANMETEINAALKFGITAVLPLIQTDGWDSPKVRQLILDRATQYFRQRFPDRTDTILAAAGPSVTTSPVQDTLSARLPEAMTVAASSPATPTAPGNQP
jgi:hypothetical protein